MYFFQFRDTVIYTHMYTHTQAHTHICAPPPTTLSREEEAWFPVVHFKFGTIFPAPDSISNLVKKCGGRAEEMWGPTIVMVPSDQMGLLVTVASQGCSYLVYHLVTVTITQCNKLSGWLKAIQMYNLTVLGVGSLKWVPATVRLSPGLSSFCRL